MRVLAALPFALVLSITIPAQTQAPPAQPEGLTFVKYSWSKERIGWERDPFGGPLENFDEMRARARNEKRLDDAKRGGNAAEADRIRRESRADAANAAATRQQRPARYGFLYKASLKNEGSKAVTEFDWDYVFLDAATGTEVGHVRFTSDDRIEPGKKKDVSFFVSIAPANSISVHALNSKERQGLVEQVILMRVLYEDGTTWQRR